MVESLRAFASPGRYVQGPGALSGLGQVVASFGTSAALVVDAAVHSLIGIRVEAALDDAGVDRLVLISDGEITGTAIDELERGCAGFNSDVVVGLGGGKSLDKAKALSKRLGVRVITVPTIASNDSPTSRAIAMYNDAHEMVGVDSLADNPAAVLVDTSLVAAAPADFLRSGIGDAVSKVFEAEACRDGSGVNSLGTRPLAIAVAIGQACLATLVADAAQAVRDCEADMVSPALERVVEACILHSGLAFENGGLSVAHSLTRGLMRVEGARRLPHGYHVGWGALVQLVVEGRSDEAAGIAGLLSEVGLPTDSAGLGLDQPWKRTHAEIARFTMTAPHLANTRVEISVPVLVRAMADVDLLTTDAAGSHVVADRPDESR